MATELGFQALVSVIPGTVGADYAEWSALTRSHRLAGRVSVLSNLGRYSEEAILINNNP